MKRFLSVGSRKFPQNMILRSSETNCILLMRIFLFPRGKLIPLKPRKRLWYQVFLQLFFDQPKFDSHSKVVQIPPKDKITFYGMLAHHIMENWRGFEKMPGGAWSMYCILLKEWINNRSQQIDFSPFVQDLTLITKKGNLFYFSSY